MRRYSVAALVLDLKAGAQIQILPAGDFRGTDGRPAEVPAWKLDAALAKRVIARAKDRANRLVIDFEHQSLKAETNGQPAPAAGWFKSLEWREGGGLFTTDAEWTARAKQMIDAGEYRYLSPVFRYDTASGEVLEVLMAAVTNVPALDGMIELAAAKFDFSDKEQPVNEVLKKALAALGLAETASETEVTAAIAALKAQVPDPAKFVPVTAMKDLQDQVATLRTDAANRGIDEIVAKALADGKLLPAQETWARSLGGKDLAALKEYIASAQPIPALLGTQTHNRGPGAAAAASGDIVAAAKAEFEGSAALREEFIDLATYTAWRKADAGGRVKVLGRTQH